MEEYTEKMKKKISVTYREDNRQVKYTKYPIFLKNTHTQSTKIQKATRKNPPGIKM